MPTTKAPTRSRKTSTAAVDALGPEHESLLLTAYRELPEILSDEIYDVEPLNEALRECADERRKEIEEALANEDLPAAQQAILRAVPDIQFGPTPNIRPPTVTLGWSLRRWRDARGEPKSLPETICVVDFCVEMLIPKWSTGDLRSLHSLTELKRPEEALSGVGLRPTPARVRVLGLVFTSNTTVGQAVHQIERVIEAGRIDSVRDPYERPKNPYVICVTNRWELAQALADKVDVMWVDSNGEVVVALGHLLNAVTVD